MTTIGKFNETATGYAGRIETLTLSAAVQMVQVDEPTETGPAYRVYANGVELGAGWMKLSRKNTPYLAVVLDDPTFLHPIHCRLFEHTHDEFELVWSRK